MTFGTYIKSRRIERGLTLREAALRSDIPLSDWSKMERDVNAAPRNASTRLALVNTLGIYDDYFSPSGIARDLAMDSWETPSPVVTDIDIEDHMPLFIPLTDEQKITMRPLIRESLTRNEAF